jgi:hypothetical protein
VTDTTYADNEIEILANFAEASSPLRFRVIGTEDWMATPFQVADAAHQPERALKLINEWADAQS